MFLGCLRGKSILYSACPKGRCEVVGATDELALLHKLHACSTFLLVRLVNNLNSQSTRHSYFTRGEPQGDGEIVRHLEIEGGSRNSGLVRPCLVPPIPIAGNPHRADVMVHIGPGQDRVHLYDTRSKRETAALKFRYNRAAYFFLQ